MVFPLRTPQKTEAEVLAHYRYTHSIYVTTGWSLNFRVELKRPEDNVKI